LLPLLLVLVLVLVLVLLDNFQWSTFSFARSMIWKVWRNPGIGSKLFEVSRAKALCGNLGSEQEEKGAAGSTAGRKDQLRSQLVPAQYH